MVDDLSRLDGLIKAQRAFNESTSHHYRRSFYDKVVRSPNWDSRKGRIEARVTKQLRLPGALLNRFLNDVLDDNKIVIEIGSGCLNQCSYCSIRRIKGLPVSRSIADIMAELRKVYRPGLSVNLVCDDGGSYGHDIGTDLLSLLYAMDKEYPGIPIEICYLHPRWLVAGEAAYSNAFQELNIVSLNSPVQSGSDQVLSAMKRTYRAEDVRRIFREIKRLSPQTLLWGHLIYGHPVERWGDFMKSIDAALGYDYFLYCGLSPVNEEDMEACRGRNAFSMFIKEAVMKMLQHFIFFRLIWRSWRSGPELRYGHVKTDGAK
jgi:tRNA A37 methylthiotransferase MiaB